MIVQLEDKDGIFELDIPMSCAERTLNDYHDYKAVLSRLPEAIGEDDELDVDLDSIIIEAVSKMVKGDLLRLDYGGSNDISFEEGGEVTTLGLYTHLTSMILNYEADESFEELEWEITVNEKKIKSTLVSTQDNIAAAFGLKQSYTTGELLTYKEYENRLGREIETHGDVDGNFAFTLDSIQLALLFRRKGEPLPMNKRVREKFIERRSKDFKYLPLDIYLNVAFFLKRSVLSFVETQNYITSLTKRKGASVVGIKKRTKKRKGFLKRRGS